MHFIYYVFLLVAASCAAGAQLLFKILSGNGYIAFGFALLFSGVSEGGI